MKEYLKIIQDIATAHPQVKTVSVGDIFEVNGKANIDYALFNIDILNSQLEDKLNIHTFRLYTCDRMYMDKTNTVDVQSDMYKILEDVIRYLSYNDDYIITPSIFTPFIEQFKDMLAGYYCDVTVQIKTAYDNCNNPVGINHSGQTVTDPTMVDYSIVSVLDRLDALESGTTFQFQQSGDTIITLSATTGTTGITVVNIYSTPHTDLWLSGQTVQYVQSQISGITDTTILIGSGNTQAVNISGNTWVIYTPPISLDGYWTSGQTIAYVSGVTSGLTTALSGLTDVTITIPATNDVLMYSGDTWINKAPIDIFLNVADGELMSRSGDTIIGITPSSILAGYWNSGQTITYVSGVTSGMTGQYVPIQQTINSSIYYIKPYPTENKFEIAGYNPNGDPFGILIRGKDPTNSMYLGGVLSITDNAVQLAFIDEPSIINKSLVIQNGGISSNCIYNYDNDYSSGFTELSLINKDYADNRYSLTGHSHSQYAKQSDLVIHTGNTGIHRTSGDTQIQINNSLLGYTQTGTTYQLRQDFNSHSGDTSIHFKMSGITISEGQVTNLTTDLSYLQTQIDDLSAIQTIGVYYVEHKSSDIGGYESLVQSPLTTTGNTEVINLNNNTVLFDSYATPAGGLGVTGITSGLWTMHGHFQFSSVTGNNYLHWDVYKRTSGGTETFLFRMSTLDIGVTTLQEYQIEAIQPAFTGWQPTDRMVLKIYAQTTGGAKTATMNYASTTTYGFMQSPLKTNSSPLWSSIQGKPSWLSGTTLSNFEASHSHSQYALKTLALTGGTSMSGTSIIHGTPVAANKLQLKGLYATNLTITPSTNALTIVAGSIAPKNFWTGTAAAYAALGSWDSNTIYFVT